MATSVHPQAQEILDGKAAAGAPPLWELTPEEARAGVDANNAMIPAGPALESVRNIVIPSQAGGMPARVYSPSTTRRGSSSTTTAAAGWSARSTAGTPRCGRSRPPPAATW